MIDVLHCLTSNGCGTPPQPAFYDFQGKGINTETLRYRVNE